MPTEPWAPEDQALLEKLARRVVELRLETPALLTLETARPLSVLAGQAMLFFEPFAQALLRLPDYRRLAALVERREALEALATLIERATDERERLERGRRPADDGLGPGAADDGRERPARGARRGCDRHGRDRLERWQACP